MRKVFILFLIIPAVVGAAGWTSRGLEGERVTSMVMNPYFGYMTAGTAGDGVFWSGDRGETWIQVNDSLGCLDITDLTYIAPFGKECLGIIVYAGTSTEGVWWWNYFQEPFKEDSMGFWEEVNDSLTDPHIVSLASDEIWKIYTGTYEDLCALTLDTGYWISILNYSPVIDIASYPSILGDIVYVAIGAYGKTDVLMKSCDGGDSWDPFPFAAFIYTIEVDPAEHNTIYVGCMALRNKEYVNAVAKSTDGGENWDDYGCFTGCVVSLCVNPLRNNVVYAGLGSGGVYESTDYGETWTTIDQGLGDLNINCLSIWRDTLYAGTDDGIWRYLIDIGVEDTENDAMVFQCYPNPTRGSCSIMCDKPASIMVYDIAGRTVETFDCDPGKTLKISFRGENTPGGIYFIRAEVGDMSVTERIAVLR